MGAYLALNHGPIAPEDAPRLIIQAQDPEDIQALSDALAALVPLGLRVEASVIRDKLGLPDPPDGAEVLGAPAQAPVGAGLPALNRALAESAAKAAPTPTPDQVDLLAARLEREAQPHVDAMVAQVRAMADAAGSLEELLAMLEAAYPALDAGPLAAVMTQAGLAAELGGMAEVLDESGE